MYIKRNVTTKPSGKKYVKYFLVEGYRDKKTGKVKQKYVLNLSSLPENSILALQESLKGNTPISNKNLEDLEVLSTKQYGNIKIFSKLYDQYFGKYFTNKNYNNALRSIIINKIFDSRSKNSINNWLNEVDMGYKISNKNDFYDCLDYLESEQEKIEKRLSKQNQDQDNNIHGNNILLYDITSTYFEGKGAEEICKYGYSRDHRSDRVQVNIGVITSSDGTPISVEIIAGNITDKQTLQDQIDKIKNKFNIKDLTFIFDRGMKSKVNLEYLQEAGYSYITALSHSELKKKSEESKDIQMSLFDKKDLASFEVEDKYYSLVHNPMKAYKDKNDRLKLIEKTEEKIKKIQELKKDYSPTQIQDKISKIINKYKCEKYFNYEIKKIEKEVVNKNKKDLKKATKICGQIEYNTNTDKITLDEKYDGFYMIESTNKKIKEEKSVDQYKDLQLVERAFDSVKNHIEIRPVFHYKESRIKGHIFSCFMSYFLLHKFKQEIQELLKESTLDEILTQTKLIQKTCFRIGNFCFDKIVNLSDIQEKILKKFKISCCA